MTKALLMAASAVLSIAAYAEPSLAQSYRVAVPCLYPEGWNAGAAYRDISGTPVGLDQLCAPRPGDPPPFFWTRNYAEPHAASIVVW